MLIPLQLSILQQQFLNNPLSAYLWAVIVFIAVLAALKIIESILLHSLRKILKKTKNDFDDFLVRVIKKINVLFYIITALYFAIKPLRMPEYVSKGMKYALVIIIAYEIIKAVQAIVDYVVKKIISKKTAGADSEHIVKVSGLIFKILLWAIAIIIVLSNLGFNVSSLVAGLGIGGIAIALAAQNILQDLFSAFSIYIDRPFAAGDFIVSGDYMGVVKKVGIKSTRITALRGEEIIISNKDLTGAPLQNFKKMQKRRIEFMLGVTYETAPEKLRNIPKIIEDIIKNTVHTEFDRAHFKIYGDFSLNYEIVYYVLNNDYNKYMDIQQEINLAIFDAFAKEGIEFAYPTQMVYIKK
ncbi:MAG: mechanosensitive ion channel family protein [bacterium]